MKAQVNVREDLDMSAERRTSNELTHLIRKLRWMGMEDEAKIVEGQLAARPVPSGDSVVGGPRDTD